MHRFMALVLSVVVLCVAGFSWGEAGLSPKRAYNVAVNSLSVWEESLEEARYISVDYVSVSRTDLLHRVVLSGRHRASVFIVSVRGQNVAFAYFELIPSIPQFNLRLPGDMRGTDPTALRTAAFLGDLQDFLPPVTVCEPEPVGCHDGTLDDLGSDTLIHLEAHLSSLGGETTKKPWAKVPPYVEFGGSVGIVREVLITGPLEFDERNILGTIPDISSFGGWGYSRYVELDLTGSPTIGFNLPCIENCHEAELLISLPDPIRAFFKAHNISARVVERFMK